jgi:phosphoribosylformimino-5-aminoimidazole carboxamide ribotide isomerase
MTIYPAIDIKDGKCVNLIQGDFAQTTVYNESPAAAAKAWAAAGARYIHVVDLDGARSAGSARYGSAYSADAIAEIIAVGLPVQVGGGIRSLADVDEKIAMGVSRVIIGTAAVKNRDMVAQALAKYGDKIAIGIDARAGAVAISAWEETVNISAIDLCLDMKALGAKTIIYTDILRDGMLAGPNIETTAELIRRTGLDIIASGGVTSLDDLREISRINAEGAIIGKALYTGALDLAEALALFDR